MDRTDGIDRDLETRLATDRPQMTPIELDELKRDVMDRVSPSRKSGFLKSRLALTSILALGILMSGTGATMAVTGIAGDGDAAQSQYPDSGTNQGGTQGEQETSGTPGDPSSGDDENCPSVSAAGGPKAKAACPGDDEGETLGDQQSGSQNGTASAQAADQVAAGSTDDRLPFTGFIVFPLLLGGVALLATGLVLRRKAS